MLPEYSYSDPAVLAFVIIPLVLAAALVAAVAYAWRRAGESPASTARAALLMAAGTAAWMSVTWMVAAQGTFRQWNRIPPSLAMLVLLIVIIAARLAMGGVGRRLSDNLPLWLLVGIQGFRLPLELAMHTMAERGIMPEQMSYSGRNFDILTGVTAIIVAALLYAGRGGRALVLAWNVAGMALLLNIMVVAFLSTPIFAVFGEDRLNVWITYPPFVWLPAVMVLAALTGHLIIFRAATRVRPV
jgi:hypothetical protein